MEGEPGPGLMRLELLDVWAAPPGAAEPAVRGVTLEVRSGEWVALGGPNGCGKTTVLLVAAGLRAPQRGARRVSGGSTGGSGRVATVLQDPSVQLLQPTVAEEIALTALNLGTAPAEAEAEARRWGARLGLEDDLARRPETLSAGRQQLVLLAAALAIRPDWLVADEAGAHLDAESRARVLEAIRAETRRGLGVLWATQDPTERAAADRAVDLGGPRVVTESASPAPLVAGQLPAMVLSVAAWRRGDGPCVRAEAGFELEIAARGVTALIGPNGAGKSVLLAAATGVLRCPQVERRPAAVPGAPPLLVSQYPERQIFEETVARELLYAAICRGMARGEAETRASEMLQRLGFAPGEFLARRTWELSAGEKRMVLLVAGLLAPAGLLALDEPTAGLDASRREALGKLVAERARDAPVLVAGQDLGWFECLPARPHRIPPTRGLPSPSKKTD